jgi:tRNA dimethylallyltransferase
MVYQWINDRVDRYMHDGFLAEVQSLIDTGLSAGVRNAAVIGYNELLNYLDGCATLEQSLDTIKMNTRRYAKRQVTWFKVQSDMNFYVDKPSLRSVIRGELKGLESMTS